MFININKHFILNIKEYLVDLKKAFGKRLKNIRLSKNLTQENLAELININQRQISKIETGEHFPSANTLEKLCNVLDVLPCKLFDFEFNSPDNQDVDEKFLFIKNLEKLIKNDEFYNYIKLASEALFNRNSLHDFENVIAGLKLTNIK